MSRHDDMEISKPKQVGLVIFSTITSFLPILGGLIAGIVSYSQLFRDQGRELDRFDKGIMSLAVIAASASILMIFIYFSAPMLFAELFLGKKLIANLCDPASLSAGLCNIETAIRTFVLIGAFIVAALNVPSFILGSYIGFRLWKKSATEKSETIQSVPAAQPEENQVYEERIKTPEEMREEVVKRQLEEAQERARIKELAKEALQKIRTPPAAPEKKEEVKETLKEREGETFSETHHLPFEMKDPRKEKKKNEEKES